MQHEGDLGKAAADVQEHMDKLFVEYGMTVQSMDLASLSSPGKKMVKLMVSFKTLGDNDRDLTSQYKCAKELAVELVCLAHLLGGHPGVPVGDKAAYTVTIDNKPGLQAQKTFLDAWIKRQNNGPLNLYYRNTIVPIWPAKSELFARRILDEEEQLVARARDHMLAFCMGSHRRLGSLSSVGLLSEDTLGTVGSLLLESCRWKPAGLLRYVKEQREAAGLPAWKERIAWMKPDVL